MKSRILLLLVLLTSLRAAPVDPALQSRSWLMEVLTYSYYWYLDDAFFAETADTPQFEIWVRSTEPAARDAGDRSRFGEIWLPSAKVLLAVKQSDYTIEELKLAVRSAGYRVQRGSFETEAPEGEWTKLSLSRDDVYAELKTARMHLHVPDEPTKQVVRAVVRRELTRFGVAPAGQRFHIAGRTGVSTDVWVYWENRRVIFQISGDMDLAASAANLEHLPMLVRQYRLESNVVASLLEPDRTNAVITRDRASRVIFLCMVRGEELVLE